MSKDVNQPGIGTEEAKDLELDEEARPARKAGNTAVSEADETDQKKRKGIRKVSSVYFVSAHTPSAGFNRDKELYKKENVHHLPSNISLL